MQHRLKARIKTAHRRAKDRDTEAIGEAEAAARACRMGVHTDDVHTFGGKVERLQRRIDRLNKRLERVEGRDVKPGPFFTQRLNWHDNRIERLENKIGELEDKKAQAEQALAAKEATEGVAYGQAPWLRKLSRQIQRTFRPQLPGAVAPGLQPPSFSYTKAVTQPWGASTALTYHYPAERGELRQSLRRYVDEGAAQRQRAHLAPSTVPTPTATVKAQGIDPDARDRLLHYRRSPLPTPGPWAPGLVSGARSKGQWANPDARDRALHKGWKR